MYYRFGKQILYSEKGTQVNQVWLGEGKGIWYNGMGVDNTWPFTRLEERKKNQFILQIFENVGKKKPQNI